VALRFTNTGNDSIGRITIAGAMSHFSSPLVSNPDAIAAGPDKHLWFTNLGDNSIGRITTGGVITRFKSPLIDGPVSIKAGPDQVGQATECRSLSGR
jgi:streptogramin lyase